MELAAYDFETARAMLRTDCRNSSISFNRSISKPDILRTGID
jgi:hypothetical protein